MATNEPTNPATAEGHSAPIVIGVGELLVDCFYADGSPAANKAPSERRPGGAPANVAIHAAQLGSRGIVCSRVGTDAAGDVLIEHLRREGISTEGVQRTNSAPTGTVDVDSRDPVHPTYTIHRDVAWDRLEFTETWARLFRSAAAVCFGTLALRSQVSRTAIFRALATAPPETIRVYDINLRPPFHQIDWIRSGLERCSILKLNRDEVGLLQGMLSTDEPSAPRDSNPARGDGDGGGPDPLAFAPELRERFQLRLVCVTKGAEGCSIFGPEGRIDIPGRQVQVVDAVGAGDAFTAGLIHGLVSGWPVEHAARLANEVGALVASRPGATPSLREEYRAVVEQMRP